MTTSDRELLTEIERRKEIRDDPCDSCHGNGGYSGAVCADCLGQGILLTREEYCGLLRIAGYGPGDFGRDGILDSEILDAP